MDLNALGRLLILIGVVALIIGSLLVICKSEVSLFHLPGDIVVKRGNSTFFFPITTSIILSVLITVIGWFVSRFIK